MKLIIGGDVSIKEDCYELFAKGEAEVLFTDVKELLMSGDYTLVNLECAITERDTRIKKIGPNLKAPLKTAQVLSDVGVTHCLLSNNHIFDYGKGGVEDTLAELEKWGIKHTGFGKNREDARKNLIIDNGETRVAVIAVCEHEYSYALENRMGAREYDPYDTNDDIVEAKKNADHVVVIYHGGKEECEYPSPRLLKACRSMVKHGADVVLCQHSHCLGCYEKFEGGHILYGQGNFHFICKEFENPADNGKKWNTGLAVSLCFGKETNIEFVPTVVNGKGISLAKAEVRENILKELYERSEALKDGTWYEKFRSFALSQKRYQIIPEDMREEIAHYFDCEAHTDVCKEIFRTDNYTNDVE